MFLQEKDNIVMSNYCYRLNVHNSLAIADVGTINSKINGTPKSVRMSQKLQLTATLCM